MIRLTAEQRDFGIAELMELSDAWRDTARRETTPEYDSDALWEKCRALRACALALAAMPVKEEKP